MPRLVGLTGDGAAAEAMRQIDPDVVAAYPITPQTEIVERFAEFVADGVVHTEFVAVESEHSAMSACCGSAAAGARTITCTSSQGLALMHEVLYIAAGNRLPIVLINVNRTLSAPLNIHCDHSDSMGSRDSGWIQLYCENVQEVYDTVIQAVRIAEHPEVMLPVMVNLDGFVLSHSVERLEVLDDDQVRGFVGPFRPAVDLLNLENPPALGALVPPEFHFEHKYAQWVAMDRARGVIAEVGREFGERFGRTYGLLDPYRLDDADLALVVLGSTAGTARVVVDDLRDRGIRAGMLRIRCFRPFPADEIAEALRGRKAVAIMDRAGTQGGEGGPVFGEVRAALYTRGVFLPVINYIYGLGGRDVPAASLARVFTHLGQVAEAGKVDRAVNYLDLRGVELMSVDLKELATRGSPLTSGHRLCDGCAAPTIAKQVMLGAGKPVVIVQPTGCLEISSVVFPYTAWKTPYYHNAFENAAAVASGIEAALKARKRRGDLPPDFDVAIVAIGGDGGTYDIGLQALSGALERGHRMLYVCYDNGAYMNTGIQRSGATPFGAWTTTSHVGSAHKGKMQHRKDLTAIAADHNAAYVAQASPHNFRDLMRKVKKAVDADGASFINVISPCWRGWRFPEEETIEMARLAVETCYWPLYEVEKGKVTVNYVPREKKPVSEWLKKQGRFSHFFAPGNEWMIAELQAEVDRKWEELLARAGQR